MGVRVLQGLGFGLATTLITALASQAIPVSRMGEGMGYLGLGTGLALAVGPFVGVWLKDVYGFRVMFVCVGACYLIASGIFSSIKNVSLPKRKPGSPAPKLVLFSPLVIPQSILMFVLGLIINTILVYMALFCQERGLPHADTFFVLSTIGIVFSRLNAGRIYDHFGHKYIIIPSAILMLLALFLIHQSHTRNFLILAAITYGLAIGGLFPSLQALTMNAAPLEQRTEAAASFLNSYDLGFGLGALMMGQIAQITKSYSSVYLTAIMAGFIFLVIYVFCYLRPKTLNNKTAKK
jgi:predicted MFS family arabinose efflux permease